MTREEDNAHQFRILTIPSGTSREEKRTVVNPTERLLREVIRRELLLKLGRVCFRRDGYSRACLFVEFLGVGFACISIQIHNHDTAAIRNTSNQRQQKPSIEDERCTPARLGSQREPSQYLDTIMEKDCRSLIPTMKCLGTESSTYQTQHR